MPHFFAKNLRAVAFPAQSKNFKFIFEAKSLRDKSAIIFAESTHSGQKILLSKQEKDGKFLVKFNKHFASHSKEIIKSALKEYADLVGAEIASHNLNANKIKVDSAYLLNWRDICTLLGGNSLNSSLGASFALGGNFGEQQTHKSSFIPKISSKYKTSTANTRIFDLDSANQTQNTDSALDSANQNNPSLRANPQDLRGNPPIEKIVELQKIRWLLRNARKSCGLPRSHSLARNDEILDSSLRLCSAQNDKIKAENDNLKYFAESALDSANFKLSTHEANSSIADEFLGFCEASDDDRTLSPSRKRAEAIPKKSLRDAEFACLEIGFGSGRHILHLAQNHPNSRIIGLEIYRPAISQVLRQIELLNLQNLYLASIDARVLFEVLPEKCLDRIFLHFPVPWDKNPQRRVLSEQFLSNAMRALKDDGIFELLTDSAEYFNFAKALAKDYKCVAEEYAKGEVISKYEARWRKQNKVIYRLCVANSASCGDFSHLRKARFLDELFVLSASLTSHKCENSSTILEFASCVEVDSTLDSANQTQNAESALDSAPSQNLGENISSLRDSAKQNRGNPPCNFNNYRLPRSHLLARNDEILDSSLRLRSAQNDNAGLDSTDSQNLQGGLPRRFCESARNDEILDSSLRLRSAQNDKVEAENDKFGARVAESALDSTLFVPKKICKKEYFLHIKNKYIFESGVVVFASFGAYYAPSSAYFVICGDKVSTISEIIPTRANIDAVGLFMELCFDN